MQELLQKEKDDPFALSEDEKKNLREKRFSALVPNNISTIETL
jgi:hypothetical protein